MDAETREALDASINHWKENVEAKCPDDVLITSGDCALCGKFLVLDAGEHCCEGCPVYKNTGRPVCRGTPYAFARNALDQWMERGNIGKRQWRAVSRRELAFLESLRE